MVIDYSDSIIGCKGLLTVASSSAADTSIEEISDKFF